VRSTVSAIELTVFNCSDFRYYEMLGQQAAFIQLGANVMMIFANFPRNNCRFSYKAMLR
jgi:hypothetical protein